MEMDKFCDIDVLLCQAWKRCTDDEKLRTSDAYSHFRKWLEAFTRARVCGQPELSRLKQVVCAVRDCDYERLTKLTMDEGARKEAMAAAAKAKRDAAAASNSGRDDKMTDAATCKDKPLRKKPPTTGVSEEQAKSALDTARAAADCRLLCALAAVDETTGLQRFFRDVAVLTCDRGALLMRVTAEVLADFRAFVDSVFSNRVTQIGMVLAREQLAIRDKFAVLEARTMNRAQLAVMSLKDVMPSFTWLRYLKEDGYVRSLVVSQCIAQTSGDPDAEDLRGKGLLYQLNWLRSEIDRAECENSSLQEQHADLIAQTSAANRNIAIAHCQASNDMAKLTAHLDCLRAKSADQVCTVDKLMETIQITMQNSKSDACATEAAIAKLKCAP